MNPFEKDYYGQTTINPLGAFVLICCCVSILVVKRKYAVWPILVIACFVSSAQRIAVVGINFDLLRAITMCGWLRSLVRGEAKGLRWCAVDVLVTAWAVADLTFQITRQGTDGLSASIGYMGDALSMYFLLRFILRNYADVRGLIKGVIWIAFPLAVCFLIEICTARNMFAVFGGVREVTWVRDGRLRCQGAFDHPLIAGLFWATLLPLIVSEWWQTERRLNPILVVTGACAAITIVLCTASATCYTAVAFCTLGGLCFLVRRHLRAVRWGLLLLVICLHISMQAPVWHLIARVSIVGGSSGYQRFQLIDGAITHFNEWWLVGSRVGTANWGWACYDDCDYYVVQCIHGGVVLLGLFVCLLGFAFRCAGSAIRSAGENVGRRATAWASGVCILVHCQNFIGLSYFGQMPLILYINLAAVAGLSQAGAYAGRHSNALPQKMTQISRTRPLEAC